MKRQVLTILTALVVATHGLLAQQWTEIMRIETIDSTIVLPVADVKRFAFDYINEAAADTTTYISMNDVVAQKHCVLLDLSQQNAHNEEEGEHSRNVYSAQYLMNLAGMPYSVATRVTDAIAQANMIVCASPFKQSTLTASEIQLLKKWIEQGGVFVAPAITNTNSHLCDLFGVEFVVYSKERRTFTWREEYLNEKELAYFDEPEERTVSLGKARNTTAESIKTYGYQPRTAEAMAYFDSTNLAAVLRHRIGKGVIYTFGILWRDVVQRSQLGKNTTATRITSNGFEPSADIYAFFLRSLHAKINPISVWKYTIPLGYESVLIPTHDCDSRTAYDEMYWVSEYEKSLGLSAHYFLTVHYFRDAGYLSDFYNAETKPKAQRLLVDGHTVGSHSICHFPDFSNTALFPATVVTKEAYAASAHHDKVAGVTQGGSTWAELGLSKRIIEEDLGNRVRSFRSGHLCMNKLMPMVQQAVGYTFSSCYASCNVLSQFPFHERMENDWTGAQGVLQIPLHISDVINAHPMTDTAWNHAPDIWLKVLEKLQRNYAPTVLLIHPNRDWKMFAMRQLIESMDREKVGLYNFEAYGDFWLAREKMSFDYTYLPERKSVVVWVNKPIDTESACVFAVDAQSGVTIEEAIFVDATGQQSQLQIRKQQEGRYLLLK